MGRSVSTHRHSVATVYLNPTIDDGFDFDEFIYDVRDNVLTQRYPSLVACDRWQDREDHIIAENGVCEVSISEYCGLVAVCLAPLDPENAMHISWCERAADGFRKTLVDGFSGCALTRIGTFSNGESVYQKIV